MNYNTLCSSKKNNVQPHLRLPFVYNHNRSPMELLIFDAEQSRIVIPGTQFQSDFCKKMILM